MANKTLEAKVKLNTTDAERSLANLTKKINAINKAVNNTNSRNSGLTTAITKANKTAINLEKNMNKVNTANKNAASSARSLQSSYKSSNTAASKLLSTVKSLAATYLGVMGTKAVITASDTITSAENRLNNLSGGNAELTQTSMDKIYSASQRSRSGYGDMLSNVSKSMTLAGDSFDNNIDNAIKFQEIMSKAYTVGGASAAEQSSSMYQLIQSLGSGTLQGDELRSVREGAPVAYKAIEEFAQGVLNTSDSLKDLASDGLITSDIVVAAIMNAEEQINESFNNTETTFAQAWENIKNMALQAFRPVLQMLNDTLNTLVDSGAIDVLGQVFVFIANLIIWICDLLGILFDWIVGIFNWISENWNWLSKVILTALTIIGVTMATILFPKFIAWIKYIAFTISYYTYLGVTAVASAIKTAAAWAIANWQLLLIILVIVAVISAVIWLADSFEDGCGIIVGVIIAAISVIWNAFVTLVTIVIKNAILPLTSAWDSFANFFGNLFNDPIGAVIRVFENLGDTVLSILHTIAQGIDAIFGTSLAETVQGWRDGLANKADQLAEKWGNGSYEEKSNITGKLNSLLESTQANLLWDTSDAYSTGYNWGSSGASWLTDKISGIGDYLASYNDANTAVGSSYLPDIDGTSTALSTDDLLSNLDGISSDVSDINDSMDLSNDDLEYLRKVADMEWRNEFTTAEIKVDMTNNNTVSSERDLDGIVEYLSDVLRNEMTNVAYGVHY